MADMTITIAAPIISPPSVFKYRWRLLPSDPFSAWDTEASNEITLTGLISGDYELELIYVSGGTVECPSVFKYFTVVEAEPSYDCLTWSVENEGARLTFTPTIPSPVTPYPCGYNFYFREVGSQQWQNVYYPNMPTSIVSIPLYLPGDYEWQVRGNLCDTTIICDEGTANSPEPPECVGGYILGLITLQPDPSQQIPLPSGDVDMIFGFTWMNPSPLPITPLSWSFQQVGLLAGQPPVQASGTVANNQSAVIFAVNFNAKFMDPITGQPRIAPAYRIEIEGTVEDGCGRTIYFTAHYDL